MARLRSSGAIANVSDGWCKIRSAASMLVIEHSELHGIRQIHDTPELADAALWRFEPSTDAPAAYVIRNKRSGVVLEVANAAR